MARILQQGLTRSNVSRRPAHHHATAFPAAASITLPDTGASIMSAPFSRTFAAMLAAGSQADRAHIHKQFPAAEPGQQAVRPFRNGA